MNNNLPKIIYISDVPVELSSAGATLIYRLLEHYPKEKLIIFQGKSHIKNNIKIKGVKYINLKYLFDRLRSSRLSKYLKFISIINYFINSKIIISESKKFNPDIILTVSFRLSWLNALDFSKRKNIPLCLILHDDWLTTENYGIWNNIFLNKFKETFLHSKIRFCISNSMNEYYYQNYKLNSFIMYPFRGKEDLLYPIKEKGSNNIIKFCYIGSLDTIDFFSMLNNLARILEENNHEMHIFSVVENKTLSKYNYLLKKHVVFHGYIPSIQLKERINKEMDVAIVLNSFINEKPFKYNFSSKLVDYVSAGLPVLFWGPKTSGSIKWALNNGYEAVIYVKDDNSLQKMIMNFCSLDYRFKCAKKIREISQLSFSYEYNYELFIKSIMNLSTH